jgi:hypothetical protein
MANQIDEVYNEPAIDANDDHFTHFMELELILLYK